MRCTLARTRRGDLPRGRQGRTQRLLCGQQGKIAIQGGLQGLELRGEVRKLVVDRLLADPKDSGDLPLSVAGGAQAEDMPLAGRERGRRGWCGRRGRRGVGGFGLGGHAFIVLERGLVRKGSRGRLRLVDAPKPVRAGSPERGGAAKPHQPPGA